MIISYANKLVEGTDVQEMLKHKELRRYWYYNWLSRAHRLETANIKPLEVVRAKWATSKNAAHHYKQFAELVLELGIGVPNPNYKPDEPNSEAVKIIKPGRLVSMDETRLTNDNTEKNKARQSRSIVGTSGDDGTTLVNKGGGEGTGIGGTSADGLDIPGFFIFANDIIHASAENNDVAQPGEGAGLPQAGPCEAWPLARVQILGKPEGRRVRRRGHPVHPRLRGAMPAGLVARESGRPHRGRPRLSLHPRAA